jgi:hypothetical protein
VHREKSRKEDVADLYGKYRIKPGRGREEEKLKSNVTTMM